MNKIKPIEAENREPFIIEKILLLYLEKLEKLNNKERAVIILTIDILNHPTFVITK